MTRFIEGDCRSQRILFPETLDEYIDEENSVRVVDAFVEHLNLGELGFSRTEAHSTGRPGYHPSTLLKIYIYGYLNRIQSSRRLEREAQRNIELMWLTGRLAPDFKTIADFRKDNSSAIIKTCHSFIKICRQLSLFEEVIVAIDGSKFKAVNSGDKNFTPVRMKRRKDGIEKHIAHYLAELDKADKENSPLPKEKVSRIKKRLDKLQTEMQRLDAIEARLTQSSDNQISLTDPDSRVVATSRKNSGVVGYNVQSAVDTKHHLIVAHDVTNKMSDRTQLSKMAKLARSEMNARDLTALADRGYFSGREFLACKEAGIKAYAPKPLTSGSKKYGRFTKQDFDFEPEHNQYRCPAGEALIWRFETEENGLAINKYWSSNCPSCPIRAKCTTSKYRRIGRWKHEHVVEAMEEELDRNPDYMSIRRQTVEHPFGTIKSWMGATHFLTKTLKNVKTEMSLQVLAYNLKRVMQIVGIASLIEAMYA